MNIVSFRMNGVAFEELAVWDQEGEAYARVSIACTRSYKTGSILVVFWVYYSCPGITGLTQIDYINSEE